MVNIVTHCVNVQCASSAKFKLGPVQKYAGTVNESCLPIILTVLL